MARLGESGLGGATGIENPGEKMNSGKYALGLDFGTESVRAVIADIHTGTLAAQASAAYVDGLMERTLPGSDQPCGSSPRKRTSPCSMSLRSALAARWDSKKRCTC